MSKHRLKVAGSKKVAERVDAKAAEKLLTGRAGLADALGLGDAELEEMRRQAIALFSAGKWRQCIDVCSGVTALGSVHPVDAFMMAGSYEALGDHESARTLETHFGTMMKEAGLGDRLAGGAE